MERLPAVRRLSISKAGLAVREMVLLPTIVTAVPKAFKPSNKRKEPPNGQVSTYIYRDAEIH